MVGALPATLPPLPTPDFTFHIWKECAPAALAVTLRALPDAVPISRSLARRTGDRERDIGDGLRQRVAERLRAAGDFPRALELVTEGGALDREEGSRIFGETLPAGLVLVTAGDVSPRPPALS